MNSIGSKVPRRSALVCLTFFALLPYVVSATDDFQQSQIYRLPQGIAERLRSSNLPNERGGCNESNIFIHGFRVLEPFRKHIWFLGAPDYLCGTKSFISVIVDSRGNWTVGENAREDWEGSRNLMGVPLLFKYAEGIGLFLISEWQVEGPGNLMYYSSDGISWISMPLPLPKGKRSNDSCCDAPIIESLCISERSDVYVAYEESEAFEAGLWHATIGDAFPQNLSWTQSPHLPASAECDKQWAQDFLPPSLREKTSEGALFDVALGWAVLIPGPTK